MTLPPEEECWNALLASLELRSLAVDGNSTPTDFEQTLPDDVINAFERWRRAQGEGEHHGLRYKLKTRLWGRHSKWQRLTEAIRNGVPSVVRGRVWYISSGGLSKKRQDTRTYDVWLRDGHAACDTSSARAISLDLGRTGCESALLPSLENVLLAYAARNPDVGYCQSMNFIVATFLLYCTEEESFWMLCSLIEDVLPSGYYTTDLAGLRADLGVFTALVQQFLPHLHRHFATNELDISPILMNWFLCLFVNTLPGELSHRVLDFVLHEGNKAIFRIGLAILRLRQADLLEARGIMEVYQLLREPFLLVEEACSPQSQPSPGSSQLSSSGVTPEALLSEVHAAWLLGLKSTSIAQLREEHAARIRIQAAELSRLRGLAKGQQPRPSTIQRAERTKSPSQLRSWLSFIRDAHSSGAQAESEIEMVEDFNKDD